MSTTLTIDATGGALISDAVCVEGILAAEDVANGLRVIKKGHMLVISGLEPCNAVEAIMAAREERDEQLLAFRKQ